MKAERSGLEASRQKQLQLAAAAQSVAADYERIGLKKEASDARASAAKSLQAAADLQCIARHENTLFPD